MRKLASMLLVALALIVPLALIAPPAVAAETPPPGGPTVEGSAGDTPVADKPQHRKKAGKRHHRKHHGKKHHHKHHGKKHHHKKKAQQKRNKAKANTGVWNRLARCESGGRWHINTGNGYYGGVQISSGTWRAFGGPKFAALPHKATKMEQINVAKRIRKGQGWGAWPSCSRRIGVR